MDLPEPWAPLRGVSCAGWDIVAGTSAAEPEGQQYAIFRRRLENPDTPYTKGKAHPTLASVLNAIAEINMAFHRGEYRPEYLFPLETLPNYGRF